jgi:hypothetical protein
VALTPISAAIRVSSMTSSEASSQRRFFKRVPIFCAQPSRLFDNPFFSL